MQSVSLLIVDDDDLDHELICRALDKAKVANARRRAANGEEALAILRGEGVDRIERPVIVLLDLNMPVMDGFTFLEHLRDDPELHQTVVFVLTTSDLDRDRTRAYDKHIAGYMVKDQVGKQFSEVPRLLDAYWSVVLLPER